MIWLTALFLLLATAAPALAQTDNRANVQFSGKIRVIDGDTIAVKGVRIRLFGIQAPEIGEPCLNALGTDVDCSEFSSWALERAISAAGKINCAVLYHDRYGRLVAICETNGGVNLGALQVRSGHARDFTKYSNGQYAEDEAVARAAEEGYWECVFPAPKSWIATKAERCPYFPTLPRGTTAE